MGSMTSSRSGVAFVGIDGGPCVRFVDPLLFRVPGNGAATNAAVAVPLMSVAALAGSFPAWRATRVDPREALQAD